MKDRGKKQRKEYLIRLPENAAERERAIEYVCMHMYKTHKSYPPPEKTPPHLFIALDEGSIVGTLAVEFGRKDAPLPFESFFAFDPGRSPVPYVREQTIYYSRWNSSRKHLGRIIWLAASEYAFSRGMRFSSSTAKPVMIDHCLRTLGFGWQVVPGAAIRKENIGADEQGYFFGERSPVPCLGVLGEQIVGLREIVRDICEKEGIAWHSVRG